MRSTESEMSRYRMTLSHLVLTSSRSDSRSARKEPDSVASGGSSAMPPSPAVMTATFARKKTPANSATRTGPA